MRKKREDNEKYITIKDVAEDAGVSIATVSRTINDGSVRLEKRKKVLESIKKLNYVPNESARNLAAVNVAKRIVFMVPEISRSYYSEMFKGYRDILQTYAYDPLIISYDMDEKKYQKLLKKYEMTSEFRAIIQVGKKNELKNKIIVDSRDENLLFQKSEKSVNFSYYSKDKYIIDSLNRILNCNAKEYSEGDESDKYDFYIAPTLEEALHLFNLGVTKKNIYTFESVNEIQKLCPNIKQMNFDFYGLGVTLARIAIKKTRNEEINKVMFHLKGIDELQ